MTVADQVGALLAELGVGHAFGVVGSGNFRLTEALVRLLEVRPQARPVAPVRSA